MTATSKAFFNCVFVLGLLGTTLSAAASVSRYTPFIARPERSLVDYGKLKIDLGLVSSTISTADKRYGGKAGVPELWGKYDLKDVVASYMTVNPAATNPYELVPQALQYKDLETPFLVTSKTGVFGFTTGAEWSTGLAGFELGANIGFLVARSYGRYSFNNASASNEFSNAIARELRKLPDYHSLEEDQKNSLINEQRNRQALIVDQVRRETHNALGFNANTWSEQTPTDLDVHLRYRHVFEYALLMRSINLMVQTGALFPTSNKIKTAAPLSVPFGANGHWGLYGELDLHFELKRDWKVGLEFALTHLFSRDHTVRLALDREPTIFSALVDKVKIQPGNTFKFSGHFTKGNLTDGLDFQARYTYLRHAEDSVTSKRQSLLHVQSYLDKSDRVTEKKNLSRWRSHYISFSLIYDLQQAAIIKNADKKLIAPRLFVVYDMPMQGNAAAKAHTIHFGAELQF